MRFLHFPALNTTLALQAFQLMRLGTAVVSGVILAKSGLPTAAIGAWEMLLFLSTTFTFFWVNGLLQGITPFYARLDVQERGGFVGGSFVLFCGLSLALFGLFWLGEPYLTVWLTGTATIPGFKLFALYTALNLPAFTVEYYYLLRQKAMYIVCWGVVGFGLQLLLMAVAMFGGYGVEHMLYALIALALLKLCWAARLALSFGRSSFDKRVIWLYLVFCAPLMMSNVVSNLLLLLDNWLVNWHYGDPEVFAIFRYGAREFPLATALVSALGTSMLPLLSSDFSAGAAALKTKALRLMHWLFPLTAVLILSSKYLFTLAFNPDFADSAPLFNIYLLTLASRILLPGHVCLALGNSRQLFVASAVELCAKAVLGVYCISNWGLEGLAWSVVLSFWVEKWWLLVVLYQKGVRLQDWLAWRWYVLYTAMLFGVYWAHYLWG